MPVSRVSSHRLPQNEEPQCGAKAGLGKHIEYMRSLARTEHGGRAMCVQGQEPCTVWPIREKRM